jgi:hypothetical protein
MYCPVCFKDTMKICSSGVVKIAFNGKSKNTSLFTYNLQKETQEQLEEKLKEKVDDFFKFYASLQHKTPIKTFEAHSSDFICSEGCSISISTKVSVIDVLFTQKKIQKILNDQATKYSLIIDLTQDD